MNTNSPSPGGDGDLKADLVTCSFSGDFEICKLLCESIDRFVPQSIGHTLYVPERDVALFAPLANTRRRILTQESLLPRWFWNVPMPGPRWRKLLFLPRRNIYLTPYSLPVRGWIAQQIMKIAATEASDRQIVVHVDSDNAFVRPLKYADLVRDGRVRIYRKPEKVESNFHRRWHEAAGRLLGLPPSDFYDAEYIDQLVVWRRSVLIAMIARIGELAGTDWRVALARTPQFAEYILYGVFADQALGLENAGLFAEPQTLCLSRWSGDIASEQEENAFVESLLPEHAACLIQSTISVTLEGRRRLFEKATAKAARQDEGSPHH